MGAYPRIHDRGIPAQRWLADYTATYVERDVRQRFNPLRGAIFESWVASELRKQAVHRGRRPSLFHFRDAAGLDVDLVDDRSDVVRLVEVKTSATIASDFSSNLEQLAAATRDRQSDRDVSAHLVYGGELRRRRGTVGCLPWSMLDTLTP